MVNLNLPHRPRANAFGNAAHLAEQNQNPVNPSTNPTSAPTGSRGPAGFRPSSHPTQSPQNE